MTPIDPQKLAGLQGEELLSTLEQEAVRNGISDIHINPQKSFVKVEWRELGVLRKLVEISHENFETVKRRIKFKSKLKMNVENVAQDGQYTFPTAGRMVNVRVASLPSRFGEAYTLRLLDPQRGIVPLEKLGFPAEIKTKLQELTDLPNGLILVTGPTGSGKTTTLYALLSTLSGKDRNIITLEDPVEYELKDIIQSQVDTEHGYTFASGLRAILRHDPDIILVGEIRDQETAQTAIDASLTGHLVLATLHTNSAIEAIPRLLSMGISTYTFAPALRAVLAQRLVRTINPEFRGKLAEHKEDEKSFYTGQCTLPELLIATEPIKDHILNQATATDMLETARKEGYKTMKEWGEIMIKDEVTTRVEVSRVTAA
ncbi:MAG: type II/IV secretion system protein [Candidatus Peribacteraceae bacterium]|nr:type II/IV secretion system protein [Candidatus Peribacteraceae bacterium]